MVKTSKLTAIPGPARRQAVIYARVSSKEQEKEGFSIPAQLKLLKEYAAANGLAVAQEYVDVETAKQTGRAAFGEMVAYLKSHPSVRVMLVEKTDRLYRNLKDWVTLDELDVEMHFPKEGVVLSRSACRPTMRSSAAILASYSWSRSAAWASSSKAPASYFSTQTRIRLLVRGVFQKRTTRPGSSRSDWGLKSIRHS
jgi:hypothetical protein